MTTLSLDGDGCGYDHYTGYGVGDEIIIESPSDGLGSGYGSDEGDGSGIGFGATYGNGYGFVTGDGIGD